MSNSQKRTWSAICHFHENHILPIICYTRKRQNQFENISNSPQILLTTSMVSQLIKKESRQMIKNWIGTVCFVVRPTNLILWSTKFRPQMVVPLGQILLLQNLISAPSQGNSWNNQKVCINFEVFSKCGWFWGCLFLVCSAIVLQSLCMLTF